MFNDSLLALNHELILTNLMFTAEERVDMSLWE